MSFASMHNDYLDPDRAGLLDEGGQDNAAVEAVFSGDYASPYELYLAVYKATSCGPSLGIAISFEESYSGDGIPLNKVETVEAVYCDRLRSLGTWADLRERGVTIQKIYVSSIVEGVDETTSTHEISCLISDLEAGLEDGEDTLDRVLKDRFYEAVAAVDSEVGEIWNRTHGCDGCRALVRGEGEEVGDDDHCRVHPECPDCHGEGIVI